MVQHPELESYAGLLKWQRLAQKSTQASPNRPLRWSVLLSSWWRITSGTESGVAKAYEESKEATRRAQWVVFRSSTCVRLPPPYVHAAPSGSFWGNKSTNPIHHCAHHVCNNGRGGSEALFIGALLWQRIGLCQPHPFLREHLAWLQAAISYSSFWKRSFVYFERLLSYQNFVKRTKHTLLVKSDDLRECLSILYNTKLLSKNCERVSYNKKAAICHMTWQRPAS